MNIMAVAHRGYPTKFPENTLSSFQAAIDLSFSHMELDVHLSKDQVPVVMHDHTIDKMCDGTGRIASYTLQELKQFKVSGSETIPTLEEALRLARSRISVLIELKQEGHLYPSLEQRVHEVIEQLDMADQVIVTSFDHYALLRIRQLNSRVGIGLLINGVSPAVFPFMKQISAHYMSIQHAYLTNEYVQECADNGVQLVARIIDTEQNRLKMRGYPTVWPSTNCAGELKQFLERQR